MEADAKLKELEPKALAHDTWMVAQDRGSADKAGGEGDRTDEEGPAGVSPRGETVLSQAGDVRAAQYDFYAAHADCFNAVEKAIHTWGRAPTPPCM